MKTLRVLLIQQDAGIAEHLLDHFARTDFTIRHALVTRPAELRSSLEDDRWDVAVSGFEIPGLDWTETLDMLRESGRDIPMIIVADDIGEETPASLIRGGVNDVLAFSESDRLERVIKREIQEAANRVDKREAEDALAESEVRFQLALSAAGMGAWEWDLASDSVFWSPECSLILGISVAGAKSIDLAQMIVGEDREMVDEAYKRAISKRSTFNIRYRIRRSDGEIVWLVANGKCFGDESGNPHKVVGTLRDVTREKVAEDALIEAEERYRIVAETASDAIISVDNSSTIIFANRAAETIFDYTRDELIGQKLSMLMPDRTIPNHELAFKNYLSSGNKTLDWQNVEVKGKKKDGTEIDLQISFGEFKKRGKHTFTAVLRDVTTRKKESDAVRDSERNFRALTAATTHFVWTLDQEGNINEMPQWWVTLTGQSFEESLNYGWVECIHPDDREAIKAGFIGAMESGAPIDIDLRIRDVNDNYRFYQARAVPVMNSDGVSRRWVCALIEKTAQHVAEEKLRESEERYRLISSVSADYLYATAINENGELGLDWITGAFERITGYTREEFIALGGWRKIVHPDDLAEDRKHFEGLLRNEPVNAELRIINKSRNVVWIRSYAHPIWDEKGGRVIKVCGAVQDVTDRKLAEQAVRNSEFRLRTILNAEPECVKLVDRNGTLLDINPAGLLMAEADSLEEVLGRKVVDLVVPEHKEAFLKFSDDVFAGNSATIAFENISLKGTRRFLETHAVPMRDENNAVTTMLAVTRDITERKQIEKYLVDSQKQISGLINTIEGIVWEANIDTFQITFVSDQAVPILGYPREKWFEKDFWVNHLHPDDRGWVLEFYEGPLLESPHHSLEYRMIAADGRVVWLRDIVTVVHEKGKPTVLRGIMVDVTDRKRDEHELERRAMLIDQAFEAIFVWDYKEGIIDWNKGCERLYGYTREEVLGKFGYDLLKSEFQVPVEDFLRELKAKRHWSAEVSQTTKDGRTVYADCRYQLIDLDGREIVLQTNRDVTDRHLAEMRLRESETRYRDLFENNPFAMWVYDTQSLRFLAVNDAAVLNYGYSRDEFLSMTIADIRPKEDVPAMLERARSELATIDTTSSWRHLKKDGSLIDVEITSHSLEFQGKRARLVLANNITDRLRAEEELRQQRERLEKTAEAAPSAIRSFRLGIDGSRSFPYSSPAVNKVFGMTAEDLRDRTDSFFARIHPEDRETIKIKTEESARNLSMYHVAFRFDHPVRGERWIETYAAPTREKDGSTLWHGIATDITEQRTSEEALRSSEEQLRQAQKLESIGILAGGMAHDFNNMLTAINGYSDLILRRIDADDPIRQNVEEIRKAGERSAELTRQLLAFSRRQILQPKTLDLNDVIGETVTMLQRLIGENIRISTQLEPELAKIEADPGQLTQVLVNLVVNARDAIGTSGTIKITSENIYLDETFAKHHVDTRPGHYVMLAVSDNGTGMDEETRARIFEPFFTTKTVGRGTGLGLSTAYGIVKQSGGSIWVYSERDRGTTFKIFLPQFGLPTIRTSGITSQPGMRLGTETILLVEDEETVRGLAREILESCGYSVLEAGNGVDAIEVLGTSRESVDLMITDLVMPEMGGRELAETMMANFPMLKVLYTSGYTDDAIMRHGILSEDSNFLQKPFTFDGLSKKVRTLLDEN